MAWTQEKRAEWGRAQATPEHIAKMNEARERLKRERVEAILHVRRLVNTGRGGEALTWVLSEAPTNRAVGEMLTTLNGRRALVIDHQLQRIPDSRKADWPLGEDVTDLGNGFWLCPPKTDSGERIVVLDDVMCGALDEWLAIRKQKGVDSPMLFVTGRGTPIDRRIEYFHWDKALLRIGIVNGEDGVRLRPHSARHTADTLFANAGVPERARLALMGHSDGAMDSVYLHADTEALLKVSEGATGAPGLND